MAPPERESLGRAATTALVALIVLALGGAILYLLSDINNRRYRLAVQDGHVVIEKGRRLPWGFERYEPGTPELAAAYAPIPMPTGETLAKTEVYDDRADVDRALFSLFAGWARARLTSKTPGDFELAASAVHRSELLPSLSEEQRLELKHLRADLAYRNGRRLLDDVSDRLQKALAELKVAKELGATDRSDVDRWIGEVERRLRDYREPPPLTAEAPTREAGAEPTTPTPVNQDAAEPTPSATPERPGTK